MSDDMNRITVNVEEVGGRAQVVLTVEDVDSGLRMQSVFPTTTNVRRLARSLDSAADAVERADSEDV
jgi:hypothetical protein